MKNIIEKIDEYRYRIPRSYKPGMNQEAIFYSSKELLPVLLQEKALEQLANVACLPGIVKASLAMPDIHWGYGFPIGGVAATDLEKNGVVSPGGVGFDINCGVRYLKTALDVNEIRGVLPELAKKLYHIVPAGVGSKGDIKLKGKEQRKLLSKGAGWAINNGFGIKEDLEKTEEKGCMNTADPEAVSDKAMERGRMQAGTLGSGNHFLEIQVVEKIFDQETARIFNIKEGQVGIMIHTGSRGFGHQVCTDYVKRMLNSMSKFNISVPDRQLACAPVKSGLAREYLAAMGCAANYAWCNRQIIMHMVREAFEQTFKNSWRKLGMYLLYDVAHNIAKIEKHYVADKKKMLCVHRKGATRAFGPQEKELPEQYRKTGQPVIIPGDMGSFSYLLTGTSKAMQETFGSTCHGAGRVKSRTQATREFSANNIIKKLNEKGIIIFAKEKKTICEEAPEAYKDINNVVDVVALAGIAKKICRLKPLAVIKG